MLTELAYFLYLSLIDLRNMAKVVKKTTKKSVGKINSEVVDAKVTRGTSKVAESPKSNKRLLILVAVIIGGGALLFFGYRIMVLGWVDQTPLTRLGMYQQLESRYGKDMLEQMITESLIANEAKNRRVSVSKEELVAEIKKLEDQQGGADKLDQALGFQGMSRNDLEKQIGYQLMIKKMFGQGITVSDEEVTQYIESNKEQLGVVDDKTKSAIKDQLTMQKIGQAFNTWLTENKSGSRVVRYN